MVVAVIALLFAVAGTSVAAINALTKKQKSQTRKIARSEIANAAPGLSVANAVRAQQADSVKAGTVGPAELSGSIPAVHVTRTGTAQSFTGGVQASLSFNSERYDTAGMHDNATDNSRVTAPIRGIYAITAQVDWEFFAGAAEHELFLVKNGNTDLATASDVIEGGPQAISTQTRLQAGDYIEADGYEESKDGLTILLQPERSPELSMTWLAPGP